MAKKLSEYTIDELVERVEGGSDSSAQRAEPILIAKSTEDLVHNVHILNGQLYATGKDIREIIGNKVDALDKSIDGLKGIVETYSTTSDNYAKAIKRANWTLVFFTAVQALAAIALIIVTLVKK